MRSMVAVWIAAAFALGLLARQLGLPPLIGFLGAGFLLNAAGVERVPALTDVAHLGEQPRHDCPLPEPHERVVAKPGGDERSF